MFGGIRRLLSRFGSVALVLGLFVGAGFIANALVPSVAFADSASGPSSTPAVVLNFIGNTLAQLIDFLGNAIGSLTLVIIEVVVVNVLNYNNFSSSNIVTLGWTLTRDMVNMFAVIVLLVMAVKIMVGQAASAWQQHIPRFFLGIVLANFSRTLCGLAVDASQIVMMTFVNALLGIAAGNFAQLFVMPQATTYSAETLQVATETGAVLMTLAANIANAYVKLLVQVVVMIVMLLLAIAFIWRIVILWIAFIMAPLAGFSWGSKEIVGFLGRIYQEWMGSFVPPLILGPMLAFFLYLALAASSNGNLAKTEAFPEPEKRTTYGQITLEVFESTNFTGLLIAVVFLIMGLRESAKVASKMGGIASRMFNEKTASRVFRAGSRVSGLAIGTPTKLVARAALKSTAAAGQLIEFGANAAGSKMGNGALGKVGRFGTGIVGGAAGAASFYARAADNQVRIIPTDASKLPGYAKNRGAALAKIGSEAATGLSKDLTRGVEAASDKTGRLVEKMAGVAISPGNAKKFGGIVTGALTTAGLALGPNELLRAGSALGAQEHHISEEEAKAAKERVSHMTQDERAARLQQSLNNTGEKSIEAFADAEHLKGLLLKDKKFNDTFKDTVGSVEYEKSMEKIFHDLQHEDDAGHLSVEKETWDKARSKYADILVAAAGQDKAKKFFASKDFDIKAIRDGATARPELAFVLAATQTKDKKDGKFITRFDQMSDRQKGDVDRASRDMYQAFNEMSASGTGISNDSMRALSRLEGNPSVLDATTASQIQAQLASIESQPDKKGFAESEIAAIRKNLVASGHATLDASFGGRTHSPTFDLTDRKAFKALVQDDPSALRHVDSRGLKDADTDVAKTAFDALSKESFEKMKEMVDAGARTKRETQDALAKIREVIEAKEKKARNGVDEAQVKALLKDIETASAALKAASAANAAADVVAARKADLEAAKAQHDATVAGMDKDAMDKIKTLKASLVATERYI